MKSQKGPHISGAWLVFFGAFLWSTIGGVTKCFEMHPLLLPGFRSLIGGIVLLPFLRPQKVIWNGWVIGLVLAYTAVALLLLASMRLTTAANAMALHYTSPLWIFLGNRVFRHKKVGFWRGVPIGIMVLGITVILWEGGSQGRFWGNLLAAGSGCALAIFTECTGHIKRENYLGILAVANLCASAIILIPVWLFTDIPIIITKHALPYVLYLGAIEVPVGYFCYMLGVSKTSPQQAAVLGVWEFILTPVWAYLLVREVPTLLGIIGWFLMLAAILSEIFLSRNRKNFQQLSSPD